MGNNGTEQGGRAPVPPMGRCLQKGPTLIKVLIFHKVAWSCLPQLTGRHERPPHAKLPASKIKSFKLNTNGQPALWSHSQNNPIGIREKKT